VPAHQAFESLVAAQRVATPGEGEHHLGGPDREDVVPSQCRPGGGQPVERGGTHSVRRDEDGIECTDGRAYEQVRRDASFGQSPQHAHLDRTEAATAGQHEGRRHRRLPRI
jgi:hypothetical protein